MSSNYRGFDIIQNCGGYNVIAVGGYNLKWCANIAACKTYIETLFS